jgi:hypothetical protein
MKIERQAEALDRALTLAVRQGLDQDTIDAAEAGLRTLLWVARNADKIRLARAINNDVVQQMLTEFPGVRVTAIRRSDDHASSERRVEKAGSETALPDDEGDRG